MASRKVRTPATVERNSMATDSRPIPVRRKQPMTTKFEMHKDEAQRFYFSLTATDGTELLRSLPYFSKSHARRDATHVPPMLKDEQHLHRHEMHGKYYFVLKNDRGEMFARSTRSSPRRVRRRRRRCCSTTPPGPARRSRLSSCRRSFWPSSSGRRVLTF